MKLYKITGALLGYGLSTQPVTLADGMSTREAADGVIVGLANAGCTRMSIEPYDYDEAPAKQ